MKGVEWAVNIRKLDGQIYVCHGAFTGTWRNGQPLNGAWVVPGLFTYEGAWRDGKMHGHGIHTQHDGLQ